MIAFYVAGGLSKLQSPIARQQWCSTCDCGRMDVRHQMGPAHLWRPNGSIIAGTSMSCTGDNMHWPTYKWPKSLLLFWVHCKTQDL